MLSDKELLLEIFDCIWLVDNKIHIEAGVIPQNIEKQLLKRRKELIEEFSVKNPNFGKHLFNDRKICTKCGISFEYAKEFKKLCSIKKA
jgi:hypothetical protein